MTNIVNTDSGEGETDHDLNKDKDCDNNQTSHNMININDIESGETDASPNRTEPATRENEITTTTTNNTETNPNKLRDAVDGLLLLSSGEETMDELALSQDENDTIEFDQELDMENMMTRPASQQTTRRTIFCYQ